MEITSTTTWQELVAYYTYEELCELLVNLNNQLEDLKNNVTN